MKIEPELQNHPAVEAWRRLDSGNKIPQKVVDLFANNKKRRKTKSAVFKLEGAVADISGVVAKQASFETITRERLVYESILPKLSMDTLRYFGCIESRDEHWLFIEYAGGTSWDPSNFVHQNLAVDWLARLHHGSSLIEELSLLAEKHISQYFSQLKIIADRAKGASLRSGLSHAESQVFELIFRCLRTVELKWPEINSVYESVPMCLVHNDIVGKNLQVRGDGANIQLIPFDWEMSAKTSPAVDLYWMLVKAGPKAVENYWNCRNRLGAGLSLLDVRCLAQIGVIFRYLDALEWASYGFDYDTTVLRQKGLRRAELYSRRMIGAFAALGWG